MATSGVIYAFGSVPGCTRPLRMERATKLSFDHRCLSPSTSSARTQHQPVPTPQPRYGRHLSEEKKASSDGLAIDGLRLFLPWPRPLRGMTEDLIIAFCATRPNATTAVYDINPALLQIRRKRMRDQGAEGFKRDRNSPDRPREPVLAVLPEETGCAEPAVVGYEARKNRKGLTGEKNCDANRTIGLVLLWQLMPKRMQPLGLWIPAERMMIVPILPRSKEGFSYRFFCDLLLL